MSVDPRDLRRGRRIGRLAVMQDLEIVENEANSSTDWLSPSGRSYEGRTQKDTILASPAHRAHALMPSIRLIPTTLATTLLLAGAAQLALAADALTDERVAACSAALKSQADQLAVKVKAGDVEAERQLRITWEHGYAILSEAYLNGLRDESKARALLKEAQDSQAAWPAEQLARVQQGCHDQGEQILQKASGLQHFVVEKLARKKVDRAKQTS